MHGRRTSPLDPYILTSKGDLRMNDAIRRALRTFAQTFLGLYLIRLVGFLGQLSEWAGCNETGGDACSFPDVSVLGYGLVVAASAAVVALISYLQNALEDNTNFPSVLKAKASSGQNPVTHDRSGQEGHGQLETIMLVAVVIVVVILLFIHI